MDTTIRNLDEAAYRELKARAALEGRTIGETLSDAIRAYVNRPRPGRGGGHLVDLLEPRDLGPGNERLSEEIDQVAYGL